MSDQQYGPQTAEIEAIIERLRAATLEQVKALGEARHGAQNETWGEAWNAARIKVCDEEWSRACEAAHEAVFEAARDNKEWSGAWYGARDAIMAIMVRDLITPNQFDLLYAPWAWVIDEKPQVRQPLPAEIERLNNKIKELQQQLDKTERELAKGQATLDIRTKINTGAMEKLMTQNMRMAYQIRELEADLAKFHKCEESDGCYNGEDSVHVVDNDRFTYVLSGEKIRIVYHKEGE
jgi:hypothetical protein